MAPSPTIRRLLKETAELSASSAIPNPTFHAAPVSDSNLHEWHFTLLGPPSPSPYAGGLYHGRITLPTTYPLKPPNFRFLTPSGRFEVNREICLSISGFHEETWMPAWGVRTALTALRSFMAEKGSAGQVGGMEAKAEVRERLARESKNWRCEGCGGRTNNDIMREWWEVCKERGIKVEEEMSLEELPEGLSLEAREPESKAKNQREGTETKQEHSQAVVSTSLDQTKTDTGVLSLPEEPMDASQPAAHAASPAQSAPPTTNSTSPNSSDSRTLSNGESASHHSAPHRRTHASPPVNSFTTTTPAPTPTIPNAAPQTIAANNDAENNATGTIDKAIGALFVALLIMILKKIFYPAGGPGGSMDGLYMSGD